MKIASAYFANADETAVIAQTTEAGAVVISKDKPEQWAELIASRVKIAPYAAPPEPVPLFISDRQFAQGLAMAGFITEAEAEEWVGPGVVPASLMAFVEALPADQQFAARMLLRGATQFERDHPLTEAFGALHGWSSAQVDQFWRDCAKL